MGALPAGLFAQLRRPSLPGDDELSRVAVRGVVKFIFSFKVDEGAIVSTGGRLLLTIFKSLFFRTNGSQ